MTETFEKAVKEATVLKKRPNYDEIGELYGLYKQVIVGNINIERPGIFDLAGRGKWDAWNSRKGVAKDEAMALYVDVVERLKAKYGLESVSHE
ncbi:acyl-CoA-binding protein-like isoform X1 [Enoplosus armatus]|uniref:acyl-CoA-binding protein-like isoform X1 n=1 Tax=Enoplosus armatus TaxID=215367 RepID=UPI003994A3D0